MSTTGLWGAGRQNVVETDIPALVVVGRRVMITMSYVVAGLGLIVVGALFWQDAISATQLTIGWSAIFFIASAGASAAYLTVGEIFPMETRAMAIAMAMAFFYAVATAIGGIIGPALTADS
jgi:MFS family permease